MNHVMLDLETFGTAPQSVIWSIGAVHFNADGIIDTFEAMVSPQSCQDIGMETDWDTIDWWMQQGDLARKHMTSPRMPIATALDLFGQWIGRDAVVWGNGSDFDNAILGSAYRLSGVKLPWRWSANRCYRTFKNLSPETSIDRTGEHHVALDDAVSQADHLIRCASAIGLTEAIFRTNKPKRT